MMPKKNNKQNLSTTIAVNRRARHEYHVTENLEAGLVLQGWEVKALRAGRVNLSDSYVMLKNSAAWLVGSSIVPLNVASSHIICDSTRTRKLLLKQREIDSLYGRINRQGYTVIALSIYWKKAWTKVSIGVAKGKKSHDKRHDIKQREWNITKARLVKNYR